jgi:hypothetical protein
MHSIAGVAIGIRTASCACRNRRLAQISMAAPKNPNGLAPKMVRSIYHVMKLSFKGLLGAVMVPSVNIEFDTIRPSWC